MTNSSSPVVDQKNPGIVSTCGFFLLLLLVLGIGCRTSEPPEDPAENTSKDQTESEKNDEGATHASWELSARTQHTFAEVGDVTDPAISPDGNWLYYVSSENGRNFDLYRKPIGEEGPQERITRTETNERLPAVRPGDPSLVAVARDTGDTWDIWVLQLGSRGNKWKQITDRSHPVAWPSWSTDGSKLAFSEFVESGQEWKTWIYEITTKRSREVGSGYWPAWNPRNERQMVLVDHRRRRPWMFYLIRVTLPKTDRVQLQKNGNWAASSPSWSPNGRYIVFGSVHKSRTARLENRVRKGDDIWMVKSDGTNLIQLTNTPEPEWFPVWGPGDRVYYLRESGGHSNIFSVPAPKKGSEMPKKDY